MSEVASQPGPLPPTSPVKKAPFLPSENLAVRRMGGAQGADQLTIYVFRDVLEELMFAASFRPALISTGILTGGYYRGPAGDYVEVRGFQSTAVVDSTLQFAQRLRGEWAELFGDPGLQEAGLFPLGWFVSQPDSRGRPGPFEVITHLTFFNRPYHLFCVMDPRSRLLGFYRQVEDAVLVNQPFNLIESAPKAQAAQEQNDANQ